ncbi:MAG TPA: mycofactocin precursor MftA [Ilumatobacteraceae bacterium]|jgi:mycofactocin precursor|nr:mycofactocin precursor MftA [Ilumatobacteraceae bacterium]
MENDTATREQVDTAPADVTDTLVEEELLVEEISIDGMCGVY